MSLISMQLFKQLLWTWFPRLKANRFFFFIESINKWANNFPNWFAISRKGLSFKLSSNFTLKSRFNLKWRTSSKLSWKDRCSPELATNQLPACIICWVKHRMPFLSKTFLTFKKPDIQNIASSFLSSINNQSLEWPFSSVLSYSYQICSS